jgi:predicted ATP-grasp superfamily ATP-dependent carboligase
MIEFKQDAQSGEYVLMEINARLWGSVQLAVDAGVDFPAALVDYSLGNPLSSPEQIRYHTRSVWELGEVDHALALARRSARDLHLQKHVATGWKAALDVLMDHRKGDLPEVWDVSDPLPFAVELWHWLLRR